MEGQLGFLERNLDVYFFVVEVIVFKLSVILKKVAKQNASRKE